MFAASAVGLILATKGTFAAEVAGCQVEIGAAGAMGAAAVVEVAGGSAKEACDAAAIAFQNTMGSVCDLVQGIWRSHVILETQSQLHPLSFARI